MYGKIFWIFSRPFSYILDVAIGEQVNCISDMCSHIVATGVSIITYAAVEISLTRAQELAPAQKMGLKIFIFYFLFFCSVLRSFLAQINEQLRLKCLENKEKDR